MNRFIVLVVGMLCLGFAGCQQGGFTETPNADIPDNPSGGSEFGNPRMISGSVQAATATEPGNLEPSGDTSGEPGVGSGGDGDGSFVLVQKMATCAADQVVLINSESQRIEGDIEADCTFEFEPATDQAYRMEFEQAGEIIATLFVNSSEEFPNATFFFSAGQPAMDLGVINFSDGVAEATNNPLLLNDRDGDGMSDGADTDDDNDGVLDNDEEDCDLDGFPDDVDNDSMCSAPGSFVQVLSVSPFNGQTNVGTLATIKVRVDCEIEPGLFDSSAVVAKRQPDNQLLPLMCNLLDGNTLIECTHIDPFTTNRTYKAELGTTIDCVGGAKVGMREWLFETGN